MKKKLIVLFGISAFAGAGYLLWAYTPLGKKSLIKWLLRKWEARAKEKKKPFDRERLEKELAKLLYSDLELLARYTFIVLVKRNGQKNDPAKFKNVVPKYAKRITEAEIFEKADLSQLDNLMFPG